MIIVEHGTKVNFLMILTKMYHDRWRVKGATDRFQQMLIGSEQNFNWNGVGEYLLQHVVGHQLLDVEEPQKKRCTRCLQLSSLLHNLTSIVYAN